MFIKWGQLQMNMNCQAYQILLAWSRSCLGCVRANLSWHLWPVEVWLIPCSGSCDQDWGPSLSHTGTTQVWNKNFFIFNDKSFLRVHCNKQLIVICVETPSSGGGGVHHGRDRRRRQAAQDKEVLDISEYNNLLKFLDSE